MLLLSDILKFDDRAEASYLIANHYKSSSEAQRESMRIDWDYGREWIWPDGRTLAMRTPEQRSCAEKIRTVLIMHSIDERTYFYDYRDGLIAFCGIYHSAKEIGLDPDKLFEEVAEISSEKFALELRKFIGRSDEDKSLDAFGFKRIVDTDGNIRLEFMND